MLFEKTTEIVLVEYSHLLRDAKNGKVCVFKEFTGFFYAKFVKRQRKETTPYFFSRRAPTVRAMAMAVTLLEGSSIACSP